MSGSIPAYLVRLVRARAVQACEYCLLPEWVSSIPFEIDHIIARKHEGLTEQGNLALACFYCNSAKGPNIAGIDPVTGTLQRLFHPRNDQWSEHFAWDGALLRGLSPIGRTTIAVMCITQPELRAIREMLVVGP